MVVAELADYANECVKLPTFTGPNREKWLARVREWVDNFRDVSSDNPSAVVKGTFEPLSQTTVQLNKDIYLNVCGHIVERLRLVAASAAARAATDGLVIGRILLSGAGASCYWTRQSLSQEFGNENVWVDDHPAWTISTGLAAMTVEEPPARSTAGLSTAPPKPEPVPPTVPSAWIMSRDSRIGTAIPFQGQRVGRVDLITLGHEAAQSISRSQAILLELDGVSFAIQNLSSHPIRVDGIEYVTNQVAHVRNNSSVRFGKVDFYVKVDSRP
jgi:hypothetical protein